MGIMVKATGERLVPDEQREELVYAEHRCSLPLGGAVRRAATSARRGEW